MGIQKNTHTKIFFGRPILVFDKYSITHFDEYFDVFDGLLFPRVKHYM